MARKVGSTIGKVKETGLSRV
ncbi:uncharacterized protein G2W53_018335 [Senna tora]|uniref:Uncharacterized protein n=1 Tax=Senna tora TaxID=362788 RepID=A0A834TUV6_9FABA|nr:uncharacterized protein G2W53_018335 [Senna tora]